VGPDVSATTQCTELVLFRTLHVCLLNAANLKLITVRYNNYTHITYLPFFISHECTMMFPNNFASIPVHLELTERGHL